MSTYGGAFDETILRAIRVRADRMAYDDRIKQQFIPNIDVVNAIKAAQTATVLQGKAINKKVAMEIMWDNYCDYTATTNTTCIIGGHKSSTNTEEQDVTFERIVGFSFDEADFIDNEYDIQEHVAKGFIKADVELAEAFAAYAVAQVDSFAGVNAFTGGKGTVSGTDTFIAASNWNASLVAYFNRVAVLNKFTSPLFLSGSNLYEQMLMAEINSGNANGPGDARAFGGLKMFFDLFNVDTVNSPDLKTYMLSLGSLAMGSRYFNPTTPEKLDPFTRWAIPSSFVPGLMYDVFYLTACTTDDLIEHRFKFKLQADVWNNPAGCDQNNTGVLSFTCGTGS